MWAIYVPAILTSCLAAITEPIEFTFLFVSPVLFFIHSLLTGIFFVLLYVFQITCVTAGGIFETLLYNVPAGIAKTGWPWFVLLGLVQMATYYFVFRWFILKFDIKIPGRDESEEVKLVTKKDYDNIKKEKSDSGNEIGEQIYQAVGGIENINLIDNCFTRLRITVKSIDIVDEAKLKETGSKGLVKKGNEIQIIYGVNVNKFRKFLEDYLEENNLEIGG